MPPKAATKQSPASIDTKTKKYDALLNVLDLIRKEAPAHITRYRPSEKNQEKLDYARSRALIHLFLKVRFGLLDFVERERFIVDGPNDGGLDAYFIDREARKIYFVQAKFRTSEANFDRKNIDVDEILKMEVDRIAKGFAEDERGQRYNGKVQATITALQAIEDIGRYDFSVVILANVKDAASSRLKRLVGDFPVEVIDHAKVYNDLLFPVVSGTYDLLPKFGPGIMSVRRFELIESPHPHG